MNKSQTQEEYGHLKVPFSKKTGLFNKDVTFYIKKGRNKIGPSYAKLSTA